MKTTKTKSIPLGRKVNPQLYITKDEGSCKNAVLGGGVGDIIQLLFFTPYASNTYYFMAEIHLNSSIRVNSSVILMVAVNGTEVGRWEVSSTEIHDKLVVIPGNKINVDQGVKVTINIVSNSKSQSFVPAPRICINSIFWDIDLNAYLAELQIGFDWSCVVRNELIATAMKVLLFLDNTSFTHKKIYNCIAEIVSNPYGQLSSIARVKFDRNYFDENYTDLKEGRIHYGIRKWVGDLLELKNAIIDVGNYVARQPDFKLTLPAFIEQHMQILPDFGDEILELRKRNEFLNNLEILLKKETITSIPSTLYLDITNICNFRCRMCYQSKSHFLQSEISSLHMFEIVKMMPYLSHITVAGLGEPLLSKNLVIFVDQARKYHCETHIITNGSLIASRLEALKKFSKISISFDAATAKTFETIRYRSNFKQILKNIELLRGEVPDAIICFSIVLSRLNIDELLEIVEYGEKLGINEVSITPIEHMPILELRKEDQSLFEREFAKVQQVAKRCHMKINNSIVAGTFKNTSGYLHSKAELLSSIKKLPLKKEPSADIEKIYGELLAKNFNFFPDEVVFGKYNKVPEPLSPLQNTKYVRSPIAEPSALNISVELTYINSQIDKLISELKGKSADFYKMPYCLDPWKLVYIKSGGAKRLCCHTDICVGNLEEEDRGRPFNSQEYQKIRGSMFNLEEMLPECVQCRAADRQMGGQGLLSVCQEFSIDIGQ